MEGATARKSRIDFWGLFHKRMAELPWPPHWIAQMTLPQLLCQSEEKPPVEGKVFASSDEYLEFAAAEEERQQAEEREWRREAR